MDPVIEVHGTLYSYAASVVIFATSGYSTPAAAFDDDRGAYQMAPSRVIESFG